MAITRAQAEQLLVSRCGPMMAAADMAITYAGANADLNDPIQWSVTELDGTVSDVTAVADADLATVDSDDQRYIADVAELRLLDNILTNLMLVTISTGPRSQSLDQLAARLQVRRDKLEEQLDSVIGLNAAGISTGWIVNDFAENVDTTT